VTIKPGFSIRPVIPAQAGIQQKNNPRSGQSPEVDLLCRSYLISWIPACAGMTDFWSNGKSRLKSSPSTEKICTLHPDLLNLLQM
jgi:hypothetical protein